MIARKREEPITPLLSPEQASKLLDTVVIETVGAAIDFETLASFEVELSCGLIAHGMDQVQADEIAVALIERAFDRIRDLRLTLTTRAMLEADLGLRPSGDHDHAHGSG